MPKQLNVNLAFTADTHEAKAQLASLQQDLNKLTQSVGSKSPLGITKDIYKNIQGHGPHPAPHTKRIATPEGTIMGKAVIKFNPL